ncbi:MAG: endonuclease III domain-containing protein [Spirochaetia bacterium]
MLVTCAADIKNVQELYISLWNLYGSQGWWPLSFTENQIGYHHGSYFQPSTIQGQFEVCIGTILTQNTRWENAHKALANLYHADLLQANILQKTSDEILSDLIRPSGYFRQKIKKIKIFVDWWIEFHQKSNKETPSRQELLGLWGIGEETADSILCYAYHQCVFVADAYTKKLFFLHGLIKSMQVTYREIQVVGERIQPIKTQEQSSAYKEFHALIVHHSKHSLPLPNTS